MNREAELETPSRVACSDLLGDKIIISSSLYSMAEIEIHTDARSGK